MVDRALATTGTPIRRRESLKLHIDWTVAAAGPVALLLSARAATAGDGAEENYGRERVLPICSGKNPEEFSFSRPVRGDRTEQYTDGGSTTVVSWTSPAPQETKEMVPNEESQSILPKLNRILDATIDAAKLAARIGVSFTPMNDFVDCCEFATGRENCLPSGKEFTSTERGLSALGLIAGSGKFWRGLGDLLGVRAIRADLESHSQKGANPVSAPSP